jgi:hypothetical protein
MSKHKKLFEVIRSNLYGVRFQDGCKAAELLGFVRTGGKGSHCVYARQGEALHLNFQDRDGYLLSYQVKQLIKMIDKYGDL